MVAQNQYEDELGQPYTHIRTIYDTEYDIVCYCKMLGRTIRRPVIICDTYLDAANREYEAQKAADEMQDAIS